MRLFSVGIITLFCISLFGCVNKVERFDYTPFLNSNPRSILVMMPTSISTNIDAGPAVLAATVLPLSEAGYYVLPVTMVNDTFMYNGVTEPDEIHKLPLTKLKEIFGADAVLYLNVEDYSSHYTLLDSYMSVKVTAVLNDINTGSILWQRTMITTNKANSGGNILADLIGALVKHAINEISDMGYELSVRNGYLMYEHQYYKDPILYGPLSPYYRTDKVLNEK
ncbi:MAG: GNA1162 family protein [Succinivibrionaceae bacterium]